MEPEFIDPTTSSAPDANNRHNASHLIHQILNEVNNESSPTVMDELQTRGYQRKLCEELLDLLNSNLEEVDSDSFLRTTLHNTPDSEEHKQQQHPSLREELGVNIPTLSKLVEILTEFITHRVDVEFVLPGTQDTRANIEAMGLDSDGAKSAMTLSSSSLAAARLYVTLLGRRGAWAAGMVDVGGVSAVAAWLRRWCVECRGREPKEKKIREKKNSVSRKEPERKRSKGVRKSVRINANATFLESDDDESHDSALQNDDALHDNTAPDLNATFFITEESFSDQLTETQLIRGGIAVASTLGRIAQQSEYDNWNTEAREAYIDGAIVALGTSTALAQGDNNFVQMCTEAVTSLEEGLCATVTRRVDTSMNGKKKKSPKEERANETRRKESTVSILRGLMPLLVLKIEVPNGQSGKLNAYETAATMVTRLISRFSRENNDKRVRLSIDSSSSITPKRGRKSVSFSSRTSHTPGKTFQPPSLKKSITPRRTRSANNRENAIHPLSSLIIGMLQKLFTAKGLERADARGRASRVGTACLTQFPSAERECLIKFIGDMCRSKVSSHRLLAVEVIGDVLCTDWYWEDVAKKNGMSTPDNSDCEDSSSKLLTSLRGRLMDKSPTVRMRSAMSLSEVVRKACAARDDHMMLIDSNIASTPRMAKSESSVALIDELFKIGTALVDSLRHRASTDDKATVRKASIIAWLEMLSLAHRERNEECAVSGLDISSLCSLCNDSSVATRKAAAEALTKLIKANYDGEGYTAQASALEMAWAYTVLPLVRDAELSCVSKSLEFFSSLVIEPIIEVGGDTTNILEKTNTRYYVAWRILSKISLGSQEAGGSRSGQGSLQVALQKLFVNAGNDCKSLAKNLLKAVYHATSISLGLDRRTSDSFISQSSVTEADLFSGAIRAMREGAWCLLDALTSCLTNNNNAISSANLSLGQAVQASRIDSSFLALSLKKLRSLLNSSDVPMEKRASLVFASRDCLKVIAKMASYVPVEDAKSCFFDLLNDLKGHRMTVDLASVAVTALVALTKRRCDDSGMNVYDECKQWITKLLAQCELAMGTSFGAIARQQNTKYEEENLVRILFLVGELSMVGFSSEDAPGKGSSQVLATETEPVRGLVVRPSPQLNQYVKLMLPNLMPVPGGAEDEMVSTSSNIRAHAFITLGKLCLRDEPLAKESLNILARELHQHSTSDPAVQTNALMVMGDLCVRYTNLVDKYLPFMAACLQAGEAKIPEVGSDSRLSITFSEKSEAFALVKKNAILLLSSLVLQDYIKWRGLLVFRFLAAVADKDDEVSCLARTAIRGPLIEKQPNLLASSFVESVFVFNSCKAHPIYASAASNGSAGYAEIDFKKGLLEGNEGYSSRHEVYHMMLDNMNEEQKLTVTTDIVKRILGGAMDSRGDLGIVCRLSPNTRAKISEARVESATHVLRDAFAILSSQHIKVGRRAIEEQEDEFAEGNHAKADQRSLNKERLLSKISLKHLMEIVIPVLCNLKSVLEISHSALLKDLMKYLGYIFRSFKKEVSEHLANDPTLLQELEFDMRQFEKKQRESILTSKVIAVA